ncbi:putative phage tail assembly chaperone [uncultured Microbulbifer sp.]|uniref:putative phage tail assembly chaperone n=1 Tax=uncultured Microbulbifer sp. TaxID=348147 RepID=UPI0026261A82|nr:putative phage tail assembly chaperone [uncultured Microbulbifer sp.]
MAAKTNHNQKNITLSASDNEFTFQVCREDYNKLINRLNPNNKTGPMHNFLVATVEAAHKDKLLELLAAQPGAEVALGSALMEEYTPDLDVLVKKS